MEVEQPQANEREDKPTAQQAPVHSQVTPQATPQTPPRAQAASGGCDLVSKYDWDQSVSWAVCMAESTGNPNAANMNDHHGSCIGSFGLFQIACIHGGIFYDPQENVQKAYEIYRESGWQPWGAFTDGSYRQYLK